MEGLSSVICWEEKRVEDEIEVVNGHPQMTINQEVLFLPLGHLSSKSPWINLGVPALSPESIGSGSQVRN